MTNMTRRQLARSALAAALLGGAALPPAARECAVIVGGGAAGAEAALALKSARPRLDVVLIERDPARLAPAPGASPLPEGFARPDAGPRLAALDRAGVGVMLDEVVAIDWDAARLALFSGRDLAFDRLLFAPGTAPRDEAIAGLDARTRHLWPAAWGSAAEARRLVAQLAAMPQDGHLVLRLPAEISHPQVALTRALTLAGWIARHRPEARLSVLDAGADPRLAAGFVRAAGMVGSAGKVNWLRPGAGGRVLSVDAAAGRIETDAGLLRADVVNFVTPQGAGAIAGLAGLTDAGGWCPCDAAGRSTLRRGVLILGDARAMAERTVISARTSAQLALRA